MPAFSQGGGRLTVQIRESENPSAMVVEEVMLYRASHALVIGIDHYTNGWPPLSMAVEDARVVSAALRAQGFDVTVKTDLELAELEQTLREFFIAPAYSFSTSPNPAFCSAERIAFASSRVACRRRLCLYRTRPSPREAAGEPISPSRFPCPRPRRRT